MPARPLPTAQEVRSYIRDRRNWGRWGADDQVGAINIITRGVMLDVPRHRGVPCVTQETPVHGWELEDILAATGMTLEPGDAVCVYAGREAWQAANADRPYSRPFGPGRQERPG